jgi:hypothetical protein
MALTRAHIELLQEMEVDGRRTSRRIRYIPRLLADLHREGMVRNKDEITDKGQAFLALLPPTKVRGIGEELAVLTHKVFVPRLITQIYKENLTSSLPKKAQDDH